MRHVKILMLEDDQRLRSVVVRGLHRSGHTVDVAGTVEEARWFLSETKHDVLVFDVMLPDGDGFTLCRELRAAGNWSPVLMLTARDAVTDRVRGLDVGADDYLVKPFAFAELEARLRALDRRGPSDRPTNVVVGELELDPAAHRATVGSRDLGLTGRQFSLLEFFARRADSGSHPGPDPRPGLGLGIRRRPADHRRLRPVASPGARVGPGAPWIETVRGVGYALRPVRTTERRA